MKNILKLICLAVLTALPLTTMAQSGDAQPIYDLIERVTPGYCDQYQIEFIEPTASGEDHFEIDYRDSKVLLRGNTPVAIATAFNWYLKYTCKAQISWFGDQLNLPKTLPTPQPQQRVINGQFRVNFNYCTISYTASWWNWERWQREIDFMAMNGINTPLQTIGLDAVWYHTLLDMGFTDSEAREFLVLPAHQAWQWMPNIESIGGGLPMSWIESHKILARQIYQREQELGMTPIQQAFTGYVPKLLKEKYPEAKIAQQPEWYGFEGVSQLDPLDPLFAKMGALFMKNQKELFGNHGIYAADPFHESTPPDESTEYLEKVGKVIYGVIRESDPEAMVAMQSWSIREPILSQFPKENIVVLSLDGARQDFWDYNCIVGNLHNFGGRINLHGDMPLLASNQYVSARERSSRVVGSGLFMESINQNPAYYALAYEMPMHNAEVDLSQWMDNYLERAYGKVSESARGAWDILLETVYSRGTNGVEYSSVIAARPAMNVKKSGPNEGFHIPYDEQKLYHAQELLLSDSKSLVGSALYRFDVMDLQRQIMSNLAQRIQKAAVEAYREGDIANFKIHSERFLELLLDVDELLSDCEVWNFDNWISDARSWGESEKEKDKYECDATELITYWGFTLGYECKQFDYSWREWTGHIRRYYFPRWKMLFDHMLDCYDSGALYDESDALMSFGREAFRGNSFYDRLADWEISYAHTPKDDIRARLSHDGGKASLRFAKKMFDKYSAINRLYIVQ